MRPVAIVALVVALAFQIGCARKAAEQFAPLTIEPSALPAAEPSLAPQFNTRTMVQAYVERLYMPSVRRSEEFWRNDFKSAETLFIFKTVLRAHWPLLHFTAVEKRPRLKLRMMRISLLGTT